MLHTYAELLTIHYSYKYGHINSPETDTSTRSEVHVYYDHVPNELIPTKGAVRTKWVFLTSIASTKAEALEAYELGIQKQSVADPAFEKGRGALM